MLKTSTATSPPCEGEPAGRDNGIHVTENCSKGPAKEALPRQILDLDESDLELFLGSSVDHGVHETEKCREGPTEGALTRQVLDLDESDVELFYCSVVDHGVPQPPVGRHRQVVVLVLGVTAAVAARWTDKVTALRTTQFIKARPAF